MYVILVALIAVFAAYRNTGSPAWLELRVRTLQKAVACVEVKDRSPACQSAMAYAAGFTYHDLAGDPSSTVETTREFRTAIDQLIRQRSENLAIRFPLIGLSMDVNDLAVISGLTLCALLYIFMLTLSRELNNLMRASDKADRIRNKDGFELLLMSQLFSAPRHDKTGTSGWFLVVFAIPAALYSLVLREDWNSWPTATTLLGGFRANLQMGFEMLFFAGILALSVWCLRGWRRNEDILADVREKHRTCETRWAAGRLNDAAC